MENYKHSLYPEQKARKNIDKMLELSVWAVQNKDRKHRILILFVDRCNPKPRMNTTSSLAVFISRISPL